MKSLAVTALFLLGAAPPVETVPIGVFRTWGVRPAAPLRFTSGGVAVTVEAKPCPTPPDTEGCRYDYANNQASITVRAAGLPPFRMASDRQASFVRIAVVRFDRRDVRPGIVVDNQSGGSGGLTVVTAVEPTSTGYRPIPLGKRRDVPLGGALEGQLVDHPRDIDGDGKLDFVLLDGAFESAFGCNACTPRPPIVLSVIDGHSADLSDRPSVRSVFAHDIVARRAGCRLGGDYRNGACAAYVADAARLGRFVAAWRDMLTQFEHGPRGGDLWQDCTVPSGGAGCPTMFMTHYTTFPESLRAFLVRTGYITLAQAAAAPLS